MGRCVRRWGMCILRDSRWGFAPALNFLYGSFSSEFAGMAGDWPKSWSCVKKWWFLRRFSGGFCPFYQKHTIWREFLSFWTDWRRGFHPDWWLCKTLLWLQTLFWFKTVRWSKKCVKRDGSVNLGPSVCPYWKIRPCSFGRRYGYYGAGVKLFKGLRAEKWIYLIPYCILSFKTR